VPQSRSGQRLQEKSFRLCRGSNLNHPVTQPVARHYSLPTELPGSRYLALDSINMCGVQGSLFRRISVYLKRSVLQPAWISSADMMLKTSGFINRIVSDNFRSVKRLGSGTGDQAVVSQALQICEVHECAATYQSNVCMPLY
jgi:hypothetical protein